MYLTHSGQDPKTAEQVLMEVLALLESAPEPVSPDETRSLRRAERQAPTHIDLTSDHDYDDLDDLEVPEIA